MGLTVLEKARPLVSIDVSGRHIYNNRITLIMEACSVRKATLGIMESWRAKVHMKLTTPVQCCYYSGHIDLVHMNGGLFISSTVCSVQCFSAVGSALPGRAAASKGGGVHSSKSHVSWVKNGASQFVLYLLRVLTV